MDFSFSAEHNALRETVRKFCAAPFHDATKGLTSVGDECLARLYLTISCGVCSASRRCALDQAFRERFTRSTPARTDWLACVRRGHGFAQLCKAVAADIVAGVGSEPS